MDTQEVFNSKIKKIRIELPHYSFNHSSSGDSPHAFIGRERIKEKIKQVIEDSPEEPGVYLIAGNRGVGKTNLVSEVIKETSLSPKNSFSENLKYLLLLFLAIAGTQFCLQKFVEFAEKFCGLIVFIILSILSILSFILLCFINIYNRKILKQTHGIWRKICNFILSIINGITSAIKELSYLINPHNPDGKIQYLLKTILIVCDTQIISKIRFSCFVPSISFDKENLITPTKAFVFYLYFVYTFMFWRFVKGKLHEYYRKNKRDKKKESSEYSIYDIENKGFILWINRIFKCYTTLLFLFLPLWNNFIIHFNICKLLVMLVPFIMIIILVCIWLYKYLDKKHPTIKKICCDLILYPINPIKKYIKNHNRLYLRINFGHKLKDEKDILRLITRTLSTEYNKYHRSFWQMLPWRIIAFCLLLLFASLFSPIVKTIKDSKHLEIVFLTDSKIKTSVL